MGIFKIMQSDKITGGHNVLIFITIFQYMISQKSRFLNINHIKTTH